MTDKTVYAFTQLNHPEDGYVGFVNVRKNEEGHFIVSVRAHGGVPTQHAEIVLNEDQLVDMALEILAATGNEMASDIIAAEAADDAATGHIPGLFTDSTGAKEYSFVDDTMTLGTAEEVIRQHMRENGYDAFHVSRTKPTEFEQVRPIPLNVEGACAVIRRHLTESGQSEHVVVLMQVSSVAPQPVMKPVIEHKFEPLVVVLPVPKPLDGVRAPDVCTFMFCPYTQAMCGKTCAHPLML